MSEEAYVNWQHSRAQTALSADWFEVNSLMTALQKVKREYLEGTKADFKAVLKCVFSETSSNQQSPPYSETKRFPLEEKYICDALGDWKSKLTHLRALCQFANSPGDISPSESDVEQYNNLVFEMIDDLFWSSAVLDREEFELWGSVRWGHK